MAVFFLAGWSDSCSCIQLIASTVDSFQFCVACCNTVSGWWRYITNFSLVQLLPWSCL